MSTNTYIIKKPKSNIIGIIPMFKKEISNNKVTLDVNSFFIKKGKYFLSIERKCKNDDNNQIKEYIKNIYNTEIKDKNIRYFGKKGNVLIFIIEIDNMGVINEGVSFDSQKQNDYSWKRFFHIDFETKKENINNYNLHLDKLLLSEKKKQKISLEEIYNFLK